MASAEKWNMDFVCQRCRQDLKYLQSHFASTFIQAPSPNIFDLYLANQNSKFNKYHVRNRKHDSPRHPQSLPPNI
jgi:hypothetical protein